MIPMTKTYGVASSSALDTLEKRLGAPLPQQYRDFLLSQNGGRPDLPAFIVPNWGESIANTFYGVGIGGLYDLDAVLDSLDDVIPVDCVIPIADDPGGNQICVGIRGDFLGKIYFWVHDEMDEDEVRLLIELAPSFEAFVKQTGG
jgi:cell wall assembly regulator SMI1